MLNKILSYYFPPDTNIRCFHVFLLFLVCLSIINAIGEPAFYISKIFSRVVRHSPVGIIFTRIINIFAIIEFQENICFRWKSRLTCSIYSSIQNFFSFAEHSFRKSLTCSCPISVSVYFNESCFVCERSSSSAFLLCFYNFSKQDQFLSVLRGLLLTEGSAAEEKSIQ